MINLIKIGPYPAFEHPRAGFTGLELKKEYLKEAD